MLNQDDKPKLDKMYENIASVNQIRMLEDCLGVVSKLFNGEFDELVKEPECLVRQKRLSWIEKSVFYASVVDYGATK